MKYMIILKKASKKKELSGSIADRTAPAEKAGALSFFDLVGRYK